MIHKYSILNYNPNGAILHKSELEALLSYYQPTIAVICDTHLFSSDHYRILGYEIVRDDISLPEKVGGVAILIKSGTPYQILEPIIPPIPRKYHLATIKFRIDNRSFTLTGLYRRPKAHLQPLRDLLALSSTDRRHILVGDFNASHQAWNNSSTSPAGTAIAKTPFTVVHPNSHTHRQYSNPSCVSTIDLLLTQVPHEITKCTALDFITSDHRPVLYELRGKPPTPVRTNYAFNKADWKLYKRLMFDNTPSIVTIDSPTALEETVQLFTNIITQAADQSIPKFAPSPPCLRPPPPHILALIAQRNNIKNKWYRTRNPSLRGILNSLTTQIKSLMKMWKTSLWHDTLLKTHGDHKKFWKLIKTRVTKRNNVAITRSGQLLDNAEQAEILATHFSNFSVSQSHQTEEAPRMTLESNFMFVSPRTLSAILRRTKGNKSPGLDRVQYVLLRQLPRKSLVFLTQILNSCIRLRHFPTDWKHAVVIPLRKPAKSGTSPDHYRPISLLPHLSKILEKVIHKFLVEYCDRENIIPPEQTGFQPGLSTEHSLARLQSKITQNFRSNRTTALISIDCTKAFDTVVHDILLSKLRTNDCPEQLYNLLHSFLRGRTFQIRVGTSLSGKHPLPCGVPQGSVLAPILFNIYTGHIIAQKYHQVEIAAYADDIAIYSTSINPKRALSLAEKACQDINERLKLINITVNPAKTDAIVFSHVSQKKPRKRKSNSFKLENTQIATSSKILYLGLHLDRSLTFHTHFNDRTKIVRRKYHSLKHLFLSPNLSIRLKLLIYKGILRPSLLYASPIFRHMCSSSLQQLQSFQNNIIRKIARKTPFGNQPIAQVHDQLTLPTISQFILRRHIKFFDSLQYLDNPLFKTLTPPPAPNRWNGRSRRVNNLIDLSTLP